jgi:hypothetical protein
VGFAVNTARKKLPELARWRYKIQIDVDGTKRKAEGQGFSCRPLEGQPKNKKGKNGWGEPYPLNQYEITGGTLPSNSKICIGPKTTQIFFFGNEIAKPSKTDIKELERFLDQIEPVIDDLEKTEAVMNELAAFVSGEKNRFGLSSRIQAMVPCMYRLIQSIKEMSQKAIDALMDKVWGEIEKAGAEMFQGQVYFARRRIEAMLGELVSFQQKLINMAKEWNGRPNHIGYESGPYDADYPDNYLSQSPDGAAEKAKQRDVTENADTHFEQT